MGIDSPPEIGRRLGVTKHAIYLWKKGKMPGYTALRTVARVAELGNISIQWLLTGEGEAPPERKHGIGDLVESHLKPETASKIRERAGNDADKMARLICSLVEQGLEAEQFIRAQSEKIEELALASGPRRRQLKKRIRHD